MLKKQNRAREAIKPTIAPTPIILDSTPYDINAHKKSRINGFCAECGEVFEGKIHRNRKFCNFTCRNNYNKKYMSEKTRLRRNAYARKYVKNKRSRALLDS